MLPGGSVGGIWTGVLLLIHVPTLLLVGTTGFLIRYLILHRQVAFQVSTCHTGSDSVCIEIVQNPVSKMVLMIKKLPEFPNSDSPQLCDFFIILNNADSKFPYLTHSITHSPTPPTPHPKSEP